MDKTYPINPRGAPTLERTFDSMDQAEPNPQSAQGGENRLMSQTHLMAATPRTQKGFTLIEVLIAALVLSLGLLGLAGLHTVTLKMNQGSNLRTQANNLAYEIADAMRANRANAASYADDADASSCDPDFTSTASDLGSNDFEQWENRIACLLPEGQGNISIAGNIITITLCWNESHMEEREDDDICDGLGLDGDMHLSFETQL